jgi:hypothetical protein
VTKVALADLYPDDLPDAARTRIEIAYIQATQDLIKMQEEEPEARFGEAKHDLYGFYIFLLSVWRAYAHELCDLGRQRPRDWPVHRIRKEANQFRDSFAHIAYQELGRNRRAQPLPAVTDIYGNLLQHVVDIFQRDKSQREFEAELQDVANQRRKRTGKTGKKAKVRKKPKAVVVGRDWLIPKLNEVAKKKGLSKVIPSELANLPGSLAKDTWEKLLKEEPVRSDVPNRLFEFFKLNGFPNMKHTEIPVTHVNEA